MSNYKIRGRVHKFGDHINTDYIIAGKYTKTMDYDSLADHLFEDIAPGFRQRMSRGDLIVAGENFGCGSSREQAPIAIKYAGAGAVLARSFSRIFFRNAINLGIPAVVCDTSQIADGEELLLDFENNRIKSLSSGILIETEPLAPVMVEILGNGGLVNYLKRYKDFVIQ